MRGRTGLTTRSQDVSPPAHSLPFNLHALAKTEEVFASLPTPPVGPGTATLPHPNPTHSFWTHSTPDANPLAKEGSDAPLPPVVDVAIIGSGISGIGVAYHLAELLKKGEIRKPISIAVFEARDFCAGATGRNDEWSLARNVLSNLTFTYYTQKFGRDECLKSLHIERQCVDDIVGIVKKNKWEADVDLAHGGNLRLHFTKEEEQEDMVDFRAAKEAGIKLDDVEWLDAEKTKEKYGAVFPSTLIDGYNIWPLKLVTKLFNFAKSTAPSAWSYFNPFSWFRPAPPRYTLSLYTHTPVTSIASGTLPWNVWALETPRGSVMAKVVVHCTNAYVSHLLPHMSGQDGVVPTRGQVIATRASVPRSQLWNTSGVGNEGFEYWFPRPEMNDKDGCPLIIIGGGRENTGPKYEFYTTDDSTVNPEASKVLRDFLPAVYPEQFDKGTAPEMEWTGIMGYTKTYEPILGPVLDAAGQVVPGQYMSVGFSGHGMTRAFRCAEAIASMVHDELSGKLVNIPEWLPKHYLRGWKIPQPRSSDESGVDAGKL